MSKDRSKTKISGEWRDAPTSRPPRDRRETERAVNRPPTRRWLPSSESFDR